MTFDDFSRSLDAARPPSGLTPALAGLWWDGKGDWKQAHEAVQDHEAAEASWVHAYLHRKEGDKENAAYWYRRAKQPICREDFAEEWRRIASALIA